MSIPHEQRQCLSGYSSGWEQEQQQQQTTSQPASPSIAHQKTFITESTTHVPPIERTRRREIKDFKPFAHRTLPLLALFLIVLGLIGALEYGMRALPQATAGTLSGSIASHFPGLDRRSGDLDTVAREIKERQMAGLTTTGRRVTTQPVDIDDIDGIDYTTPNGRSARTTTTSSTSISYGVLPDAYLKPSAETVLTAIDPGASQVEAIDVADQTPAAAVADQSSNAASPTATREVQVAATGPVNAATASGSRITSAPSLSTSTGRLSRSSSSSSRSRDTTLRVSANPSLYLSPTKGIDVVVTTTIATRTSGGRPLITLPAGMLDSEQPLALIQNGQNYFFSQYLPAVVAVLLRLMFSYLHRATKLVDPFFMLNDPEGAAAWDFYKADHLGTELVTAPYQALRAKRWLLLWTAVLYACAQILIPFAAELTAIHNSNYTFLVQNGYGMVRGHAVWINPIIGRLIQGLLSFMAIMLIAIWFMLRRHRSGISSSPASIATMASLLGHPMTVADFASIDQGSSKKAIERTLGGRRYKLGYYHSADGSERYGIVPVEVIFDDGRETGYSGSGGSGMLHSSFIPKPYSHVRQTSSSIPRAHGAGAAAPQARLLKGIISLALVTCSSISLFGVILAYYINRDPNSAFELFMDSQSFGPRFVMSVLALLVKAPLVSLCAKTTSSIPYARLHQHSRLASPDLTSPTPLTPFGAVYFAIWRCEWYAASLAVCAGILVECMLILIPGVPFREQQIFLAATAGWYGCMACLAVFILVSLVGWVRLVRRTAEFKWPLNPGRIGTVAAYVAGTRFADDMATSLAAAAESQTMVISSVRTWQLKAKDVERAWRSEVTGWGMRYGFGARDGRWVVEYENHSNEKGGEQRMQDVPDVVSLQGGQSMAYSGQTDPQMERFANIRYDVPGTLRRSTTYRGDSDEEADVAGRTRNYGSRGGESTGLMNGRSR